MLRQFYFWLSQSNDRLKNNSFSIIQLEYFTANPIDQPRQQQKTISLDRSLKQKNYFKQINLIFIFLLFFYQFLFIYLVYIFPSTFTCRKLYVSLGCVQAAVHKTANGDFYLHLANESHTLVDTLSFPKEMVC